MSSPFARLSAFLLCVFLAAPCRAQADTEVARREEIRVWIQALLADADSRAALLSRHGTAGWDDGFFAQSADGSFRVEFSAYMQVQYVHNVRRRSGDDDSQGDFVVRRLKPSFEGHLLDPSLEFKVSANLGPDAALDLSDAILTKSFDDGVSVSIGQFKPPLLFEELTSAKRQLAVDRSVVNGNALWNQGRSLGVQVEVERESWRFAAMYHQGLRNDNTVALSENVEYAVAARAECLLAGSWRQFRDLASWPGEPCAAMVGAAVNIERDEFGSAMGPEERRLVWTVDGGIECDGASVYAALLAHDSRADGRGDLNHRGAVVQGGVFVAENLQLIARYEWADFDGPGVADLGLVTIGVNRFFAGHDLKWSADVGWGVHEVDSTWARSSAGWLADGPGRDDQLVVRTQVQIVF